MTAMDQSGFYGVFSLSFTAKVTEDNLDKLRPNAGRHDGSVDTHVSSMIEEVTGGDLTDSNSMVVDSYTGTDHGKATGIDRGDSVLSKQGDKGGKKGKGKKGKKGKEKEEPKEDSSSGGGGDDLF
jgi:hypothetical protein